MPSDVFLESIDSSTSMTVPKGPPILPKLATLVNDSFKTELETGQRKQIKDKYMVPENCTEIFWPPVNEHICNPLKPDVKGVERALVAMQDTLVVASGAIATSLNDLLLSHDNTTPLDHKAIATCLIDVLPFWGLFVKSCCIIAKKPSAHILLLISDMRVIARQNQKNVVLEMTSQK